MRFKKYPTYRKGDRPSAAEVNGYLRELERADRMHVGGSLSQGYGGIWDDPPRRQLARLTSAVGGGKYNYKRVIGTAAGGYADDPSDVGTCWEDNKTTGLPASATAGTGSLVVELVWVGQAAEWRFPRNKCS
jgi:hypothetical protein